MPSWRNRTPAIAPPFSATAAIIAVGVSVDGRGGVHGAAKGPSDAEPFPKSFTRSLSDRGLDGVKLVITDDHTELYAAAVTVLTARQQCCWLRSIRNALANAVPKQQPAAFHLNRKFSAKETADGVHPQ